MGSYKTMPLRNKIKKITIFLFFKLCFQNTQNPFYRIADAKPQKMSYYTTFYDFRLLRYQFLVKNRNMHKFSPPSGETIRDRTKVILINCGDIYKECACEI